MFSGRAQAAKDAGLSKDQAVQSLRVANIPEDDFDEQVDSSNPPTVTKLAEQGRQSRDPLRQGKPLYQQMGISMEAFQAGMHVPGGAETYLKTLEQYDLVTTAQGLAGHGYSTRMRRLIEKIDAYHDRLIAKTL